MQLVAFCDAAFSRRSPSVIVCVAGFASIILIALAQLTASRAEDQQPSQTDPLNRRVLEQHVTEHCEGEKMVTEVAGNWLCFGVLTTQLHPKDFPTEELSRDLSAHEWRAPYCTLWRDGCERCKWDLGSNSVQCYDAHKPGVCHRSKVVCEEADIDLISSFCSSYYNGCNECGLTKEDNDELGWMCTAARCTPQKRYARGFTCIPVTPSCLQGTSCDAIKLFRKLRLQAARARLQA